MQSAKRNISERSTNPSSLPAAGTPDDSLNAGAANYRPAGSFRHFTFVSVQPDSSLHAGSSDILIAEIDIRSRSLLATRIRGLGFGAGVIGNLYREIPDTEATAAVRLALDQGAT